MNFEVKNEITDLQKQNAQFISDYLNNYVLTSRYARKMSVDSSVEEGEYRCDFIMECDGFFAVIQYDSFQTLTATLDIRLVYHGCDYRFSVYDIFNLFDINDFKRYYYTDCLDKTTIEKALEELTSLIDRYGVDFKKAGSSASFGKLKSNFEADQKLKNGDYWQERMGDAALDATHISFMHTTAKSTEKLIQRLENNSNNLCIYEKRLLDYLKSGNVIVYSDLSKISKTFKKTRLFVNTPILLLSFAIVAVTELILYKTFFAGAFIPSPENIDIKVMAFDFKWVALFGSAILIYSFFSMVFGRWIIRKIIPDYAKAYAEAKYAINGENTFKNKLKNRVIIPIGTILFAVIFFVYANVGIAFYDDYVIDLYLPTNYEHMSYDSVKLYQIENDEDGERYDELHYAVGYGSDYAYLAPCKQDSKTDKKIKEIASSHGKSIITVSDKDELEEIIENTQTED